MSLAPPKDLPGRFEQPFRQPDKALLAPPVRLLRLRTAVASRFVSGLPVLLALMAGTLAIATSFVVFPLLSENNDEAVYLLQADSLRHGHLFPRAPENWKAFLPALSVWNDGRYVPKYTPVHGGIIATADLLTGTQRAALALTAMLAAGSSYLLARQVLAGRRAALFAATFFSLSPLTIIQSGTFLPYLSALALLQGSAAALLAGTRRESARLLLLGGLCLGTALFSRPYDTLLFAAPLGLWLIWVHRRTVRKLIAVGGWIGLGALLPVGAMLAFFHASTGGWFDSPFNLLHPSDTIGFGSRQMYAQSRPTFYTPQLAWLGLSAHLRLLSLWCFGGICTVAFAVAALRRMSWDHPGRWLGLVAVTIPIGYFLFWGSYGSIRWGAPFRLGPFYYLPVLAPLSILGAAGFDRIWMRARGISIVIAIGMLGISAITLAKAAQDNAPFTQARRQLYGPLEERVPQNALIFLPRLTGSSLLTHPFALARNPANFSGGVLWALDRGPAANLAVLEEFPERDPYRLRTFGTWKRTADGSRGGDFKTELEPLQMELPNRSDEAG